jgi:hypothetical protein
MAPHFFTATTTGWTIPIEIFALSGYLSQRRISVDKHLICRI